MSSHEELINSVIPHCYKTNNRFAYYHDLGDRSSVPGISAPREIDRETKIYNFVPTYDKWCLCCAKKDCKLKCSKCKLIYYCSKECQIKSHPIHKKHCSRDLFTICMGCGTDNYTIKCAKCPVKYCDRCYDEFSKPHDDIDCEIFSKTFSQPPV